MSRLHYDNASHVVSFTAPRYPLYLVARIEAATTNSSWQLVKSVPLKKKPYEFLLPKNIQFKNLRLIHLIFCTSVYRVCPQYRVSLCVETDPGVCGQATQTSSLLGVGQLQAADQLSTRL